MFVDRFVIWGNRCRRRDVATMNVIRAVQLYLEKMISEAGPGMKMLMMDRETVSPMMMMLPKGRHGGICEDLW